MSAADSTKYLLYRDALRLSDIAILQERINNMIAKDSARVAQISVMQEQRKLYDAEITNLRRVLRKEQRKRFWTAVGGILTTAGAFYLGLKL